MSTNNICFYLKLIKYLPVMCNYEMLDCALMGECAVIWYVGVLELPISK